MTQRRLLAIGDIHGCLTALDTLVGFVDPSPEDTLVFLGDYVDRGPDSKGVIDRLLEWRRKRKVVTLRGNHEIMMRGAREGLDDFRFWAKFGGIEALESYAVDGRPAALQSVPAEHWAFLDSLLDRYETETHVFVHANLHPYVEVDDQISQFLHWQPLDPVSHRPHLSGKTMVCGHTQQRSGVPLVLKQAVCIDTWAYGDGWLTCLDVASGKYWQATELGATRSANIPASGAA